MSLLFPASSLSKSSESVDHCSAFPLKLNSKFSAYLPVLVIVIGYVVIVHTQASAVGVVVCNVTLWQFATPVIKSTVFFPLYWPL